MLKRIKEQAVTLSLLVALSATPATVYAVSGSGFIEGSSESTSALVEDPGFEAQINRINVGVNLLRVNEEILYNMPIAEDSEWVDKVVAPMTSGIIRRTLNMDAVKNDAYYSTASLTNVILGRRAISMTPLTIRLYHITSTIYKNKENDNPAFHIPSMYELPSFKNVRSFVTFKSNPKVALIDVEAKSGNKFSSVEDATLWLIPDDLREEIIIAKDSFHEAREAVSLAQSEVAGLKAWLDDDANAESPEKSEQKEALVVAKVAEDQAEDELKAKEKIYFGLFEGATAAIEVNFDQTKVPLAKKLEKLLDTVDNNVVGAGSMFTAAGAGLVRGLGMIQKELKALVVAQALTTLVGNQKRFLGERVVRMGVGSLLAIPSITVGVYYAGAQLRLANKYQSVVKKVLEGGKIAALSMNSVEK